MRVRMFVAIGCVLVLLSGCATTGTGSTSPYASAEKFSAGAKWVLLITDVMVPVLCVPNGKLSPQTCMAYYDASRLLKENLITIDDLIAKGATPETVSAAVAKAMATYLMIDAAYRGQL